jgi:transposase
MHKKQPITDSLFGTLNEHQCFLIEQSWNHIICLQSAISKIKDRIRIEWLLLNYQEELALLITILITIPGIKK